MSQIESIPPSVDKEELIDFHELFEIIWKRKKFVLILTLLVSFMSILYSISLPNLYKSEAILSPINVDDTLSQNLRNFGGLASLAGLEMPNSMGDKKAKALEKLNSLSFYSENILPKIYLPDLMAIKSWDSSSKNILYDNNIFNTTTNKWVRDFKFPQSQKPSAQESWEVYKEIVSISEDRDTGFVRISVTHMSPYKAKDWTELIVNEINDFFRSKDKIEAETASVFLNTQIAKTNLVEVKQVIAELLQKKTQQLALIEANEFYVFEYLDPPVVMEEKDSPNRKLIFLISTFLGLVVSLFITFLRHYSSNELKI